MAKMIPRWIFNILIGVTLAMLGWMGTQCYNRLLEIQKDLAALHVQIATLQTQVLTRDDVREIFDSEFSKRGRQ